MIILKENFCMTVELKLAQLKLNAVTIAATVKGQVARFLLQLINIWLGAVAPCRNQSYAYPHMLRRWRTRPNRELQLLLHWHWHKFHFILQTCNRTQSAHKTHMPNEPVKGCDALAPILPPRCIYHTSNKTVRYFVLRHRTYVRRVPGSVPGAQFNLCSKFSCSWLFLSVSRCMSAVFNFKCHQIIWYLIISVTWLPLLIRSVVRSNLAHPGAAFIVITFSIMCKLSCNDASHKRIFYFAFNLASLFRRLLLSLVLFYS